LFELPLLLSMHPKITNSNPDSQSLSRQAKARHGQILSVVHLGKLLSLNPFQGCMYSWISNSELLHPKQSGSIFPSGEKYRISISVYAIFSASAANVRPSLAGNRKNHPSSSSSKQLAPHHCWPPYHWGFPWIVHPFSRSWFEVWDQRIARRPCRIFLQETFSFRSAPLGKPNWFPERETRVRQLGFFLVIWAPSLRPVWSITQTIYDTISGKREKYPLCPDGADRMMILAFVVFGFNLIASGTIQL